MKKLTNEETKDIFEKYFSKLKNIHTTLLYVYRARQSEGVSKDIISRNSSNTQVFLFLFWVLLKYFFISFELINTRKQIFKMLFNEFSPEFTETELIRIISEPTNFWLNKNYEKITLLENFCDKLLNDEYIIEKVCQKGNISSNEFQNTRNLTLQIFHHYENTILENSQKKARSELSERFVDLNIAVIKENENQAHTYTKEFEDDSLLKTGGKNDG